MRYTITVTDEDGYAIDTWTVYTQDDDANTRLLLRRDIETVVRIGYSGVG